MSGTRGTRGHARPGQERPSNARNSGPQWGGGHDTTHPLIAAAQILLGLTLSCLLALLGGAVLVGVIALAVYLTK